MRWVQLCGSLSILWHCLSLRLEWKHLFQSCGHCWVFQICWHIEYSTFTASTVRIWHSSTTPIMSTSFVRSEASQGPLDFLRPAWIVNQNKTQTISWMIPLSSSVSSPSHSPFICIQNDSFLGLSLSSHPYSRNYNGSSLLIRWSPKPLPISPPLNIVIPTTIKQYTLSRPENTAGQYVLPFRYA